MNDALFSDLCRRQYAAALAMLEESIRASPPELWNARDPGEAPFWQHAMHVLFYARLYLCEAIGQADDVAHAERMMWLVGCPMKDWSEDQVRLLGATMGGMTDRALRPPRTATREELLAELRDVEALARRSFDRLANGQASFESRSPMPWMNGTRADLLVYNLRHIQHHVGRLNSMLGRRSAARLNWVGGLP